MASYKFSEILNDLVDYFLLGDPHYLLQYKAERALPDDLLTEFTTQETGDQVVTDGILIPLSQVNNYPYTIIFNLDDDPPELLREGNDLQIRQDGYRLKVEHGRIYLFTMPYLRQFTKETVARLEQLQRAAIDISNGWYQVSILAGQTKQLSTFAGKNGEMLTHIVMEPTFEFLIKPVTGAPDYAGDINRSFAIRSDEY